MDEDEVKIASEAQLIRAQILLIGADLSVMASRTGELKLDTVIQIRKQLAACHAGIMAALHNDLE